MAGAHAADKIITNANTCTVDVLGVSDNNATANTIATWSLIDYECPAGQYLLNSDGALECTECPVGSYCPGGTYTVESENMGKNTCPADYTSDAAATAESECYMGCSVNCIQQPVPNHAINVIHGNETANGKLYYGGTCTAVAPECSINFQCDTGYHKAPDLTEEQATDAYIDFMLRIESGSYIEFVPKDTLEEMRSSSKEYAIMIRDNWNELTEALPEDSVEYQTILTSIDKIQHPDDLSTKMPAQPWLNLIADQLGESSNAYIAEGGYFYDKDFDGIEHCYTFNKFKDVDDGPDSFVVTLADPTAIDCSTAAKQMPNLSEFRQNAKNGDWYVYVSSRGISYSGETSYYESSQTVKYRVETKYTSIQGIDIPEHDYVSTFGTEEITQETMFEAAGTGWLGMLMCIMMSNTGAQSCPVPIPETFYEYPGGAYIAYTCTANTINIDWNPDNGGASTQNMCYYDGPVTLPEDPVKPGYTFMGWKLVESTTTE